MTNQTAVFAVRESTPISREIRTIRVALAGCGVVGGELVRLIDRNRGALAEHYGADIEIASVLVRDRGRHRPKELGRHLITTDVAEFMATDADVVVEAIGGIEPAATLARAGLTSGRRFVTANKALIAAHGPELARLAERHGATLDFESAVGAGIPVIRALRDQLGAAGVRSIRGILNGTSNYILSRMSGGESFESALAKAQANGFAEADPTRDISGQDAADKIRILAWLAFSIDPRAVDVETSGILSPGTPSPEEAAAAGGVLRMIAECERVQGRVLARVGVRIVPRASSFGRTDNENNIVLIETAENGTLSFAGPGAGGAPTASGLLGDIIRRA